MYKQVAICALIVFSLCGALAQPSPAPATTAPDPDFLPAGTGRDIVQKACVACHSIRNVTAKRGSKQEWNDTVNKMIERGADISDADADTIVQYLSTYFGPKPTTAPASQAPSADTTH